MPVASGSGETLTKSSSSPGLVSVVKGPVYCVGGGEESPEGVGEARSRTLPVSGGDDTVTARGSFWGVLIEVLDIVAGVQARSSGFELSINSPSAIKSDFLTSEPSDVEERLEDDETEVDMDGFRCRSRAAVMTIGAEVLFLLADFIPPDSDCVPPGW